MASLASPLSSEEAVIRQYFEDGYKYDDIRKFLKLRHGISLTLDQLRRRLKEMGLKRRGFELESSIEEVQAAIDKEREVSGRQIGYRVLHRRLITKHKLHVGRNTVMMLSALHDPEGAQGRKGKRLKRRVYHSKGPDYIWHVDGYDKLKPYGFAIHGCIDGYSRKILWLKVASTNNDPYVIAGYFLDCVTELGGTATILRADRGTENTNIAFLQPFLRDEGEDSFAKEKSFMYGRSTSNQRIEAWWGQLRKNSSGWWMDYFKALRDCGDFDDSNECHVDCLRYSFMDLIQEELDRVAHEWNVHRIRPSRESPGGIPDILYHLPQEEGTKSYRCFVNSDSLVSAKEWSTKKPHSVPKEFEDLAVTVMNEDNISMPTDIDNALLLYKHLKGVVDC